jgi:hypothetical protein
MAERRGKRGFVNDYPLRVAMSEEYSRAEVRTRHHKQELPGTNDLQARE